jgi:hypothetical protein
LQDEAGTTLCFEHGSTQIERRMVADEKKAEGRENLHSCRMLVIEGKAFMECAAISRAVTPVTVRTYAARPAT